jgi:DNA-binding MurR/RpiR family transcriptional regulator
MRDAQGPGSIIERLRAADGLSPSQRKLAAHLLAHHKIAAFEGAAQIGRRLGVSEATVVRFAAALGYRGFPALQRDLKDLVLQELTTLERLRQPGELPSGRARVGALEAIVEQERENVARLIQLNQGDTVRAWARALRSAPIVAVAGMQSSASLAQFFAYHLGKTRPGVLCFVSADFAAYQQAARMTRRDVLCVLSFPRYPRALVDLARFARERGAETLVMTDSELSPLARIGTSALYAPTTSLSFVDGYAAPVCLVNVVISESARKGLARVRRSLAEFERVAERASLFLRP